MSWQQQIEDEERRRQEEQRWACVYCGKVLPERHSPCCSEVGHTETVEASDRRWQEYSEEVNHVSE